MITKISDWHPIMTDINQKKQHLPFRQRIEVNAFNRNIEKMLFNISKLEVELRQKKSKQVQLKIDQAYEEVNAILPVMVNKISRYSTLAILSK